jgi:hypothetical protein
MYIDEALNVVLPVVSERITKKVDNKEKTEEVVRIWAYHTPISKAVFDANYRILAATKSALSNRGAHYLMSAGPRIAALTLRDEGLRDAESRGRFDENGNVQDDETKAFFTEIKRLTNILCPSAAGWELLPVDAAISSGKIDTENWEELESTIIFFTCHYSMAKKADRKRNAQSTASFLAGSITSLPPLEYAASSLNSMPVATSVKQAVSSVPS